MQRAHSVQVLCKLGFIRYNQLLVIALYPNISSPKPQNLHESYICRLYRLAWTHSADPTDRHFLLPLSQVPIRVKGGFSSLRNYFYCESHSLFLLYFLNLVDWELCQWLSGRLTEPTCQSRRHRFGSWSGKIPHAVKQLSQGTTTAQPVLWSLGTATTEAHMPQGLCSATREATAMNSMLTATREKPMQKRRSSTSINKQNKIK